MTIGSIRQAALILLGAGVAVACARTQGAATSDSGVAAQPAPPAVSSADSIVDLLGTEWRLEELAGARVLDSATATLAFPQAGRVAGNGSCNRFAGPVEIRADSISFGPLVMTRMACADAINKQEASYVRALEGAERFSISGSRLSLHLRGSAQPLHFVRTKPS
jgi:heat shock protein HslJ